MLTLADKAFFLSKWNALLHAKGALMLMSVGCFSTLALFFASSLGLPLGFSPYWLTNVAAFVVIASTLLRFCLLRRGWAGVSAREVASLSTHLRGAALQDLALRQLEFDTAHKDAQDYWSSEQSRRPSNEFLDEVVQAQLLRLARTQGFVSWSQVGGVLQDRFHQPRHSLIEWIFVGRGGEPLASAEDWAAIGTPAAQMDAAAPPATAATTAHRL